MATILDVVDNFLSSQRDNDIQTMPGRDLYRLGEEVRRFARSYVAPSVIAHQYPVYLGGWPSANFWCSQRGDLTMTSLLYSGQVLVKDPISDWFSDEQYFVPAKEGVRPGYIDLEHQRANTMVTRQFLGVVIPALQQMRLLVDKGIVVLVPSKRFIYSEQSRIEAMTRGIADRVSADVVAFTRRFSPADLPVEDNMRGMFLFVGGDRCRQVTESIARSVRYFVSEYLLAREHGFNYTAPFDYEAYLCEEGLGCLLSTLPGARILHAIFNSQLPLYRGLTPQIVAQLKDDNDFAEFRAQLFQTYKDIPSNLTQEELTSYISETEEALLRPVLSRAERNARMGTISRLGVSLLGPGIRIAGSVLAGRLLSPSDAVAGLGLAAGCSELLNWVSGAWEKSGRSASALPIWTKLYRHGRTIAAETSGVRLVGEKSLDDYWGIPQQPGGNRVIVSPGAMLLDFIPAFPAKGTAPGDHAQTVYDPCPCGSGRKYKFCCRGLEHIGLPPPPR